MTVDIAEAVVIERPIATVSTFAADPANAARWRRNVDAATEETDPPTRLGSRFRFVATFFGRRLEYVYEIVEWEPSEQIAMRTADGPFPMQTVTSWRPVGDRVTHMVLRNQGAPTGLRRLVAPFVAITMRRAMRQDLDDLKRVLEARGGPG
jgi:uncharacterized membrane protein